MALFELHSLPYWLDDPSFTTAGTSRIVLAFAPANMIPRSRKTCICAVAICLCIFVSTPLAAMGGSPSWRSCANGDAVFQIDNVDLEPLTPTHGQPFSYVLSGTASREVRDASIQATVYYWGIPVYTKQGTLCDPNSHTVDSCPVEPGPITMQHHDLLPEHVPRGHYSFRIIAAEDGTDTQLMCIDMWFGLQRPAWLGLQRPVAAT